jgi:hypothetical protein
MMKYLASLDFSGKVCDKVLAGFSRKWYKDAVLAFHLEVTAVGAAQTAA